MTRRWRTTLLVLLTGLMTLQPTRFTRADPAALAPAGTIAMPDVAGRIDHLAIDVAGERLFVAALGNDTVEVIDLRAERRSARVEHLQEPQGVGYVPDPKRLFVANGRGGRVDIFDASTLRAVGRVDGLDDADNVRYDSAAGRVYVGYSNGLAALDAATGALLHRVELPGHPESFQLERAGPRIYVNVPSAQQIVVVDRQKVAIEARWRLEGARANYPMALDEDSHRLLVATRQPATLIVFDTHTGKLVTRLPTCGDADDLFFDEARKLAYVVCGEGVIAIVQRHDSDRYEAAGQIPTRSRARTGLYVPALRTLYIAAPAREGEAAEIRLYK